MPKYKVTVEKYQYLSGVVEVEAIGPAEAQEEIDRQIAKGELQAFRQ